MIETAPPVRAPAWIRHAVWWHVYPIGLLGADPTVLEVASHRWEVAF
jgi:hypothetical protein